MSDEKDEIDWRLLDRYIAGECSADESAEVERWLVANPARRQAVDAMRAGLRGAAWDTNAAWSQLSTRIAAHDTEYAGLSAAAGGAAERPPARLAPQVRRRWLPDTARPALRAAAAVLLLASGALVWTKLDRANFTSGVEASREVTTRHEQRTTLRLSDGTEVTLGANSKLRFANVLGARTRDVSLTGEAYFRVTHNAQRPFLVHAGGAITRVLGTEFGVRAYPGANEVRVVVATGMVSLRSARSGAPDSAVLTRGQLGLLDSSGTASVRSGVDLDRYLAFAEGRLALDNTPLSEALTDLGHWYDVDFRIDDPALADRRITATFRGESLDQVLDVIALALGARYERRDRVVTFRAGRDAQ